MQHHEYTVIPAPERGSRAKGAKTPADRYALALAEILNEMAAEGWDYVRAETLPSDERSGIASRQTLWHNVLIFRRNLVGVAPTDRPETVSAPASVDVPAPSAQPAASTPPPAPLITTPAPASEAAPAPKPAAEAAGTPPLRRKDNPAEPPAPRLGPAER